MTTTSSLIDSKVAERAMLKHPFYQAWTEGRLPLDTLRDYARQYFHHVEAFPRAVSAVHSACADRDGRRMLAENLAEEEGIEAGKQDHASLWMMFASGLGESEGAVRDQQLNPEKISDTVAENKVRDLNVLNMTTAELYEKFPQPGQLLRQLQARGKLPADLAEARDPGA